MMQTVAMTKITADVEQILGAVAAKIDSAAFTSWIRPLQFEICDDVLVLTAQNQFSADYVGAVYSNVLSEVAQSFGLNVARTLPISNIIFFTMNLVYLKLKGYTRKNAEY